MRRSQYRSDPVCRALGMARWPAKSWFHSIGWNADFEASCGRRRQVAVLHAGLGRGARAGAPGRRSRLDDVKGRTRNVPLQQSPGLAAYLSGDRSSSMVKMYFDRLALPLPSQPS